MLLLCLGQLSKPNNTTLLLSHNHNIINSRADMTIAVISSTVLLVVVTRIQM
jgi:hypothetical protein